MKFDTSTLETGNLRHISRSCRLRSRTVHRTAWAISGWMFSAMGIFLLAGCGSGLVGPSVASTGLPLALPPPTAVCTGSGIAAEDLAGQCRTIPTTMGALEAIDGTSATTTSLSIAPTPARTLSVARQSPPERAYSYTVHTGKTG